MGQHRILCNPASIAPRTLHSRPAGNVRGRREKEATGNWPTTHMNDHSDDYTGEPLNRQDSSVRRPKSGHQATIPLPWARSKEEGSNEQREKRERTAARSTEPTPLLVIPVGGRGGSRGDLELDPLRTTNPMRGVQSFSYPPRLRG
ncbi:translational repressor MPT5/PUF4 and related RNA-binding protein [Anopheles sinensis]|uniref:Translational repressor MPT5/PUF4 and related RNA-binding protein n=1 Tax=Anopheles sinensis TaxID=74873 RepID=A0A084VEH8_ANOSI|nr:translational repressor MPT5/PUF4 and related RNA-binding protein [Anopheles sinensis]